MQACYRSENFGFSFVILLQGVGRSGSRDWGDLDVFFAKLSGRLTSSRVESVITSLKDEEVHCFDTSVHV